MKALVCELPGQLSLHERAPPERQSEEVRLRIRRVGICGTDLHIFAGRQPYLQYPRVMGHEFAAEVLEAPVQSGLGVGEIVFVMPYLSCGECAACRKGRTNCCTQLKVLGVHIDGALAEQVCVPRQFVHKAEGIGLDEAAMVEFLAIGAHAVRRARIEPGQRALVVGAGPIGMATALFAGLDGADVTVLDKRTDRLVVCEQALGARAIAAGDGDLQALQTLTHGEMFDVVFDATGNAQAMERGFSLVAHGGSFVLLSIVNSNITFSDPEFHKRETTLLASRNATAEDFARVLNELRAGRVPVSALATHRLQLEQLPGQFAALSSPEAGVIKALVEL